MTARPRRLLLCLAAAAALAAAGCGNKVEAETHGENEGVYITVDELKYQVQISRILVPGSIEDDTYLHGVPAGEEPAEDEVWFGIFMRVENDTEAPHPASPDFEISDTQGNTYEPLELTPEDNVFAYEPRELPPDAVLPVANSVPFDTPIRGQLLLFKLPTDTLYNRPLELRIGSVQGGDEGTIDLDV